MNLTISDLKSYVRSQSRRNFIDYGSHRLWREDGNKIQSQRRRVYRKFSARWKTNNEQLVPGNYGRLTINNDGIDFTPGQYSPMEIWHAVYVYLHETNTI